MVWHVCHMGIGLAFEIAAESRRWESSQPVACATGVQIIKERKSKAEGGVEVGVAVAKKEEWQRELCVK